MCKFLHFGQTERKLVIRHGHHPALRTVYNGDRFAPVALAVERPVLHFVLNAAFARAELFELLDRAADGILFVGEPVQEPGIDHFAVARVGLFRDIAALDHFDYINAEFAGKFPVAPVVRGNGHYRPRAVAHHDIIGDVHGYFPAVYRVYRREAVQLHARLFLHELGAFEFGFFGAFIAGGGLPRQQQRRQGQSRPQGR